MDAVTAALPDLTVEHVAQSRWTTNLHEVPFGSVYCDHMLLAEFSERSWQAPALRPYGPLPIPPSVSGLQYGLSVFEGLKAHRVPDGRIAIFRPAENARRLRHSAARFVMPAVSDRLFIEGVKALIRIDERWVPPHGAGALYLRPVLFSIDPSIRVKPGERFLFVVFACPFASYYPAALSLLVARQFVRAFPGGTGDTKPGGNYGPAMLADVEAAAQGCQTVLWLDGPERRYLEECGAMNIFLVIGDRVVTPRLTGTFLPGVTRDSVITVLRDIGHIVDERPISIDEVCAAHRAGTLRECFGTGTAATVSSVERIRIDGEDLALPVTADGIASTVRQRLVAIMTGREADHRRWLEFV